MPALTITVVSQNGEPLTDELKAQFEARGGSIGRGSGSTLLLPDPLRQISRTHALVELRDGQFTLTDQSSVTPVVVNGQSLGNGRSTPIGPGDEIAIGGYRMRVEGDVPNAPFDPDATIVQRSHKQRGDISMDGTVLSWTNDGNAAPASSIQSVIVPSPAHVPVGDKTVPATAAPVIPHAIPDKRSDNVQPAASAPPTYASAVPSPGTTADAARDAPLVPSPAITSSPAPVTPTAPSPAGSEVPAAPTLGAQTPEALLQAFLEGAGVPRLAIKSGLTPALMQTIGEMLRESVRGLLDLLQARAMTKREVRADATIIVASDNNPLKFSPTLEATMSHLLVPRGTGFMSPVRAMSDAHQSLRSHQIAFMAGMQAALASVLKRLDPHALEQRTGEPSLVAALVPTTHKAHLWEQYESLHSTIVHDAEADFQSLFGREFLKAYQSQVTRLREQDTAPPSP